MLDIEKFRHVPFETRDRCMICGEAVGEPVIGLPEFPMTEIYTATKVTEKVACADQEFHFCQKCGHGQIVNVIDVGLQYGDAISYHFRTSESATGSESADFFAQFVHRVTGTRHFATIVELGCNDLYLLKSLRSKADRLIGIDPILKDRGQELGDDQIEAIGDFFENVDLTARPDLVMCKDTLEHVSDPKQFVKKILASTTREALFFFQFPILETLLLGCRLDHIFHQHLNYFSLKSIIHMLDELGCRLLDYTINVNHWGSILIAFQKGEDNLKYRDQVWQITNSEILDRYSLFKSNMEATTRRLSLLQHEKIYGYGAALMLPVLAYHLGSDLSCLQCVLDDDRKKAGLYYINLPVTLRLREEVTDIHESIVLITAIASMNNVRRILTRLFAVNPKQIILPLSAI
ncbi:MAG: methyltransferase domain-containing protein [Desulfobaccales bacterium]